MTETDQKKLFGQTLKQLRASKNIAQFDLITCLEWRGTSPLSLIENGKRLPHRDTIDRLIECLGLSYGEGCLLLGLAGEIPDEELPKTYQIITALNRVVETLADNTAIIDFKMNYWFGAAGKNHFDTVFEQRGDMLETIQQFKLMNLLRQHLPFYQQYPEWMKSRLSAADYRAFEKAWNTTQTVNLVTIPELNHLFALVPYQGERVKLWEVYDVADYLSPEGIKNRVRFME